MPADSKVKYGMTTFSMGLNAMEPNVCRTDSRFRPDLRLLEDGNFPAASAEKHRLEEKQRAARRERGDVSGGWERGFGKRRYEHQLADLGLPAPFPNS